MSKLIIICGLPGTGKTTLANELSKQLKIPCLQKDQIKEKLYELLNLSTLEDSKKIGTTAIQLLQSIAEQNIANGVDIILEAPFMFKDDAELFKKWEKQYNLDINIIVCTIDNKERYNRFTTRPRHQAHHDTERNIQSIHEEETPQIYSEFPGKHSIIITNKTVNELVASIISEL